MAVLDALRFARQADQELGSALKTMATGRTVASAKENPTYWAMARETAGDRQAMDTVNTSLDYAEVKLDTAEAALEGVHDNVTRIQAILTLAREPGADRAKLGKEIDALRDGIRSMIESAGVNGLNYMVANVPTAAGYIGYPALELTGSLVRQSNGSLAVKTIDFSGKDLVMLSTDTATAGRFSAVGYLNPIAQPAGAAYPTMYYQLVGTASHMWVNARDIGLTATTPDSYIDEMVSALENVRSKVALALTDLGLAGRSVSVQRRINAAVISGMDRRISTLVDADMTEEAARLRALEARSALCREMLGLTGQKPEALLLLVA